MFCCPCEISRGFSGCNLRHYPFLFWTAFLRYVSENLILVLISFCGQCDGDLRTPLALVVGFLGLLSPLWKEVKSGLVLFKCSS